MDIAPKNRAAIIFFMVLSLFLRGLCGLLRVIRSHVSNFLIAHRCCDTAHRWVLALALFVSIQRVLDVLGRLAANHRYGINFWESRFVARNAVAADAHLDLGGLGVGDDVSRCSN